MPIRKGNERLQVTFPTRLKEEIMNLAKQQNTSFQKVLISICEDAVREKETKPTDTIGFKQAEDKTIQVLQQLCENLLQMDSYQKGFMLKC